MKPCQKPTASINQDNIVQFTPPKPPTWMQQAKRLHDEGNKKFSGACIIAECEAMFVGVRWGRSLEALFENMETLKKSPQRLLTAIQGIQEAYDEAYHHKCVVIPFPSVKGGSI